MKKGSWAIAVGLIVGAVFVLESTRAEAQSRRPDVTKMTCSQAQALVQKQGTVNFATGPNSWTQVKASIDYCADRSVALSPVVAPTKDNPQCQVGFTCMRMRHSSR